jgi:CRISPR-associated protein Cmr2
MGSEATLSAGIAVVHHKEDLRLALDAVRGAEKRAKKSGRDALALAVWRRSGEHPGALLGWNFILAMERWTTAFGEGASDRWTYHLRAELEALQGLPAAAMAAEIRRQVSRAEPETRRLFDPDSKGDGAGERLAKEFDDYRKWRTGKLHEEDERPKVKKGQTNEHAIALADFVTLCQSASFLARGREQ